MIQQVALDGKVVRRELNQNQDSRVIGGAWETEIALIFQLPFFVGIGSEGMLDE